MNNTQIDNTDYYRLPCGKYLEDFIWAKGLCFADGCALKYRWRKGKKDGEDADKDEKKCRHYCKFLAANTSLKSEDMASDYIDQLVADAIAWNGEDREWWQCPE